jgi:hypothetical protein
LTLQNTIVTTSGEGEAIACDGSGIVRLSCCDIYNDVTGDAEDCIASQYGVNGNISEDPLFCDPVNLDFALHEDSPCAPFTPPNPECDLIGAWPVGCGASPAIATTWGQIKALFKN